MTILKYFDVSILLEKNIYINHNFINNLTDE